jgi:hypothetical protein
LALAAGTTAASLVLATGDPCPAGGTYIDFDRQVALDAGGDIAFAAVCPSGPGIFALPDGGPSVAVAGLTSASAVGAGFVFRVPSIGGGNLAFHGTRTGVFTRSCSGGVCGPIAVAAGPLDPVPETPGQVVGEIVPHSVAASGSTMAFLATSAGGASRESVFAVRRGRVLTVATQGTPVPGTGGFITFLPAIGSLPNDLGRPAVSGRRVAFLALVDDGEFESKAIYVWRNGALQEVARERGTSPDGSPYLDLSAPSLQGGRVAFVGETHTGNCVWVFNSATGATQPVACEDEQVDDLGIIELFPGPPVMSRGAVVFRARLRDGIPTDCLFSARRGRLERLACEGEPLVGGMCFDTFERFGGAGTPFSATRRHLGTFASLSNGLFIFHGVFAFSDRSIIRVAVDDGGATQPYDFSGRVGFVANLRRKQLLFDADLRGPGARAAIFSVTLPR